MNPSIFEIDKINDTFSGHCRRLLIDFDRACKWKHRKKLTSVEAIMQILAYDKTAIQTDDKKTICPSPPAPFFICDCCQRKYNTRYESSLMGWCARCFVHYRMTLNDT